MRKIHLDKFTKEQAIEYANTEAEIQGFAVDSIRWKNAFKHYLSFAVGTMSLGRNPRGTAKTTKLSKLFPEVLSKDGFAGRISKNSSLEAIQNRIMSSVTNLVKLFESNELEMKTTTTGHQQGHIENSDMSAFQLPNRTKDMSDEEYERLEKQVIRNWMVRDLLTSAVLESLMPFFTMTKADVDQIMGLINVDDATLQDIQKGSREEFIKKLRAVIDPKVKQINIKKIILG